MRRVAIFTSACCTGWALTYDADDATQRMIKKYGKQYNSHEEWAARNNDGTVKIYDSVEAAIGDHGEDGDEETINDLQDLLDHYEKSGDGCGRLVNAAWVVHMLTSDSKNLTEWLPV